MLVILSGMEVRDRYHDLSDVEIDILPSCDELEHGEEEEDEERVAIVQGTPAAIARKRSLQRTSLSKSSPDSKRTRIAHGSATKLKSVTADQRMREFLHEHLSADCGKLVCRVCHTEASPKMRPLLEANNCSLTHSSHLTTYIPFILEEEDKQLHAEIASTTALSVVFDGSTHLGEAAAIIVRFVDTNWILQQRLVQLHVISSTLTARN